MLLRLQQYGQAFAGQNIQPNTENKMSTPGHKSAALVSLVLKTMHGKEQCIVKEN